MSIIYIQRFAMAVTLLGALFAAGCTEKGASPSNAKSPPATAADIDSRSKVIGVVPAGPTTEDPATTASKSSISKAQQSSAMPMPGQANDHSTLAPKASQKSESTAPAR